MFYSGLGLDRATELRKDPELVTEALQSPSAEFIPFWQDNCLIRDDEPVALDSCVASRLLAELRGLSRTAELPAAEALSPVLLGLRGSLQADPVFAVDLSELDRDHALKLADAHLLMDVRELISQVDQDTAGLLAYARGILYWNRNQRFCGTCGAPTVVREGGHVRSCSRCGRLLFPRIEPAVIMLVELPGEPNRCLLGRHAPSERYSTLAGFVEIGESLEDAVRREVFEESGVRVGQVHYQGSQAWPFPAGIMIGFRAVAFSEAIQPDGHEVLEARWFTADELCRRISDPSLGGPYRPDSIGKALIDEWLAEATGGIHRTGSGSHQPAGALNTASL